MQRTGAVTVKLPKSLTEYFAAANTDDADRVAACFAEDAVVRDEGRDIHGRRAIRAWAEETRRKYRFHAEVKSVEAAAAPDGAGCWARATLPSASAVPMPSMITKRVRMGPASTSSNNAIAAAS